MIQRSLRNEEPTTNHRSPIGSLVNALPSAKASAMKRVSEANCAITGYFGSQCIETSAKRTKPYASTDR